MSHLGATGGSGIQRHQQDAVKRHLCRIDQTCDLLWADYLREGPHLPRIRCLGNAPALLQDLDIEETQFRPASGSPYWEPASTLIARATTSKSPRTVQ